MEPAQDTVRTGLAAALADRYRLERELGAGGMATVYLADDVKHSGRVALVVKHQLGVGPQAATDAGDQAIPHDARCPQRGTGMTAGRFDPLDAHSSIQHQRS
jgi:hypothetical protein